MDDPYTQTAKLLDAGPARKKAITPTPTGLSSSPTPDVVVGRKYNDPQSRADEEYMEGAQRKINEGLQRGAEKVSGEYRTRRYNDRRYGRRSGR